MISLFLTNRLVEDPPHIVREVKETQKFGLKLDFFGFGLLASGFGSLEFLLDKGQEDDWFGSKIIVFFFVLCVASLVTLIGWELYQAKIGKRPILNLALFKKRTLSIAVVLMFVLGFTLYGTTVLIPQMVQTLLGYTAELAGFVISPGGVCIIFCMPIVGVLVGKVDARWLMLWGFGVMSVAMFSMQHSLSLGSSFKDIMWLRVLQSAGLAFLFIPINTISYTGVPRAQNNDVSGLTNLARNIGGSVGTAFVATTLARASQRHENHLVRNLTPSSVAFMDQVARLKGSFGGNAQVAQAFLYNQLHRQAAMLSYLDILGFLGGFCALMVPVILMIGKIKPPADGPAVH